MKGRNRRHNNMASSCCRRREGNKISSSKHWRFKGRRKKGITSVKTLQGALDREDTQGLGAFSLTQEKTGERTSKKTTIAMVIYSIGHTQQEEIKATFPAAQNILEIGSGPRIHPAQLLVDAVICLLILHAVCRSKRTQHQIQM